MLAAKPAPEELDAVLASLPYPAYFSPKLDGIRALVQNGKLYSRNLKLIPNLEMQKRWGRAEFNGLDGEIVVGPPTTEDCFNRSTSAVMARKASAEGSVFYVFDCYCDVEPFSIRLSNAALTSDQSGYLNLSGVVSSTERYIQPLEHILIKTHAAALKYEEKKLAMGYEGVMRRSPAGGYKQGRSTINEGGLIAVKRFVDAEAIILATNEQMENTNAQKVNELGRLKRSTHKAGKVGKNTLGAFTVAMVGAFPSLKQAVSHLTTAPKDARFFDVGSGKGLTNAMRDVLWLDRSNLVGQIIKFRYQKIGTMIKPRQPIFLGFRSKKDL